MTKTVLVQSLQKKHSEETALLGAGCVLVVKKIKLAWVLDADRVNGKHKVKLKVI